ncbi:hypothetical protein BD770DRAFT_415953 [Pilaira anomala]|nr:hypothetical protein BD770DRAFT_415953 [Pilaira anomala]
MNHPHTSRSSYSPNCEKHNVVLENSRASFVKDSVVSVITNRKENPISIDLEHSQSYSYLPGEIIHGVITVETSNQSKGRVDIHLSCTYRVSPSYKRSIFKVMIDPIWISNETNQAPFSLTIPSNLPTYNNNDKVIVGKIEYKMKAIYEMTDLPLSLYPKISLPILISERISTSNPLYVIPTQNRKEITITIPRDIVLKNDQLLKGEKVTVSAKLFLSTFCFLPGQNIPFKLKIQHVAPVKQIQGIQIMLERTIRVQEKQGDCLETTSIAKIILPFVCDINDYSACITDQVLKIPENISPTSCNVRHDIVMPFYIQYRLKAFINMDMYHISEDVFIRKRDRAYSMVTKMIGNLEEQENGPGFFYKTTIELELPVIIGTTTIPPPIRSQKIQKQMQHLPSMMVASPEIYHSAPPSTARRNMIFRLESDPTQSESNEIHLRRHQCTSTSSFFSPSVMECIKTPSAPPLPSEDRTSPPPYLA